MTLTEILSDLRGKAVDLWAEGDKLCYSDPHGALTPALLTAMAARKAEILGVMREGQGQAHAIPRAPRVHPLPLSFAQERLWILNRLQSSSPVYNISEAARLDGPLHLGALQKALDAIVVRHEILRTTIVENEAGPVQVIAQPAPLSLRLIDLTGEPEARAERTAARLIDTEVQAPFDLSSGPMLRAVVLRLGQYSHIFLLVIHHIVCDAWSMKIFFRELAALYTDFYARGTSSLTYPPIQYYDFSVWQRQRLQGQNLDRQLLYWKKQLSDLPVLQLPADRPRPPIRSFHGARQSLEIGKPLSDSLRLLSLRHHATLFMTVLAAFEVFLHRYSGQEDIAIGTPIANRTHAASEGLIGFFVNTVVLRADLSGNPTFTELLKRVRRDCLSAYEYQDLPFEKLVEALNPDRNLSQPSPLFQVLFSFENSPGHTLELPGITVRPIETHSRTAKFDLTLAVTSDGDSLKAAMEYNTDIFAGDTITRMLDHFRTLLHNLAADPERPISEFPLLSAAETRQLLLEWNQRPAVSGTDECMHQLLEAQARRSPEAVAVSFKNAEMTYAELNHRADRLARYLKTLGVGPEILVATCMERSFETVVGLAGILKAGGVYMPLDPSHPGNRIAFMLVDSGCRVLLTQEAVLKSLLQEAGTQVDSADAGSPLLDGRIVAVCLDKEWEALAAVNPPITIKEVAPENAAYVIYTSGSTGRPKGVAVSHESIARHCLSMQRYYELSGRDRVLQSASVSFDLSLEQIFCTLLAGATLVLTDSTEWVAADFNATLADLKLTVVNLPPAFWAHWIDECALSRRKFGAEELRLVTVGGDVLPAKALSFWRRTSLNSVRLLNAYGPTETTITATAFEVSHAGDLKDLERVPIGRPIAGRRIYILDSHMYPAPIGVAGEIYIGGDGLARGYLNRPDLTAERFVPDPFSDLEGARLYKSGDIARFLSDGTIDFLGRSDHQLKIRGFRIELGEIEALLRQHPIVRDGIVLSMATQDDKRLIAYVVLHGDAQAPASRLSAFLKQRLPSYMLPAAFVFLNVLPVTAAGKVDRTALPQPESMRPEEQGSYAAPRTPLEEMLAKMWAGLLKVKQVGIHDDFFDLGGHSLIAAQVIARIRHAFHVEISLRSLFEQPTVAELAGILTERLAGNGDALGRLDRSNVGTTSEEPLLALRKNQGV